ncbi:Putative ribonuclease H protein [Apostasia shenzhenica]|uniref:Ribonuclease H protein n=1 Tax=Apostasia shenzhenica TaxID=1088818 RepID=A0A2H9ZSM0_9ASPA|nr:Putative ribonuclease H protein [Apostasia shenzhenica]
MINIISWNCRGARKPATRRYLKALIAAHSPVAVCLLETRISQVSRRDVDRLIGRHWDYTYVPSEGKSGGIILLWLSQFISTTVLTVQKQFLVANISLSNKEKWVFAVVYAHKDYLVRRHIWDGISVHLNDTTPAILTGDFNCILSQADKKGGKPFTESLAVHEFASWITSHDLHDLWDEGPCYTWCNNKRGSARIWARLDRIFLNATALSSFTGSRVSHLMRIASDHCPLLLQLMNITFQPQGARLKFEDIWLSYDSARTVVLQAWLIAEYNSCLTRQEIWWSQRAKVRWLSEGDRNTSFFHRMATQRKRDSHINFLFNDNQQKIETDQAMMSLLFTFFQSKWQPSIPAGCSPAFPAPRALISSAQASALTQPVTYDEINRVVQSLASNRAPGVDGITGSFVKGYWHITHNDFCAAILNFFETNFMPPRWKDTLVVLVPKAQHAHQPHQFRPISLCSTIYKIVAKILVNRMKEVLNPLIAKEQGAFVPERNIADNCILAQEMMHRFRTSDSITGLMALKIDMEQAYDCMRWDFLLSMFRHFGFPKIWINWVMACIQCPRFAFMFNGLKSPWITAAKPVKNDFANLISKIRSQISLWGVRMLSLAGRLTLINSVLSSIPVYVMSHTFVPQSVLYAIEQIIRHFLWNGTVNHYGLHYVNWEKIAKPKLAGGLGIHQFSTWSKVLLVKLAVQFYANHQTLWVPFFQAKYGNRNPIFSLKRGDSYIWQMICHSGDMVLQNLKRKIGNGLSCSVLHDPWITNVPIIRWPTFINTLRDPPDHVSEFLQNGIWNETKLLQHFDAALVKRITSLPCLQNSAHDIWVWQSTETEKPPTSQVYKNLFSVSGCHTAWVWKLRTQPRFQTFLWRVCMDSLPTFDWLTSRRLSVIQNCPWGCAEPENLSHIFCNCPFAKNVFAYLGIILNQFSSQVLYVNPAFLPANIHDLLQLMANSMTRNRHCLITCCLAAALYFIWQARNTKVHGQPFLSPRVIAIQSFYQHTSKNFQSSENWVSTSLLGCNNPLLSWKPPPQSWLKINFDGAVRKEGAAIGALIRNSEGQLLHAKGTFLSTQAINIAELHAAFLAADLVKPWISKFQGVWFEGDSEHTIQQLQSAVQRPYQASTSEFHDFLSVLASFQHFKISHVYRQANMAAHYVASSSFVFNFCWEQDMSLPPDFVAIPLEGLQCFVLKCFSF